MPYLHGASILLLIIYVVFQGVAPIYMGEGTDYHVDLCIPHVEIVFTWVYMVRGLSPCKYIYMGNRWFVHVNKSTW